ncbi:MAG: adenylate/guanylate cyclase domain-containing protein [Hyphomicrobium sp.]
MPPISRSWMSALAALRLLAGATWTRRLLALVNRLAEAGTEGYPPETKRRLMILNMIAYLIAVSTLVYSVQHIFIDHVKYFPIILINLALVSLGVIVPLSHRISDIAGGLIIVVSEWIALLLFAAYLGHESGVQLQYIVGAAAPFVVFGLKRLWLVVPIILSGLALHLASWFWFPKSILLADHEVVDSIYAQAAITTFGLIAASVYYAFRLAENAKSETDTLLRNILPDSIVERLKLHPGDVIADSFTEASILFADISGFVPLARQLGAARTVELLNAVVTEFDALADRHGVEKIKTIGDAYMVASGVPEPMPDHLERLARLAIDMQAVMNRLRRERTLDLHIRIGLASGPVMAGVIGRQKFSYDVWGDAVNLAARLESLSLPGRIHICPRCKAVLDPLFEFESRGTLEIKGVGQQATWFLVGERQNTPRTEAAE